MPNQAKAAPRSWPHHVLVIPHGTKASVTDIAGAGVIVVEEQPGRWKVTKNNTGATIRIS